MKFDTDFIEKVRDANNIVDIIGQFTTLTKSGNGFKGLCPFPDHKEKTPSFHVSDSKQLYHCFGCKKGGTVFSFLSDYQGMSFPDAVEYLAARARVALPEKKQSGTQAPAGDSKRLLFKLNKFVGLAFHKNLRSKDADHHVKKYLVSRGVNEEMIEEFKLGYSSSEWSDLALYLERIKAPPLLAEKLGLIKKRPNGDGYFDLFRDRLMFPIVSVNGHVVGFGGRTLGDQQPKYLNSPESEVFLKGRTLFGLNVTAKHIRSLDEAYVVEGYMDLIGLYQAGIQNVVATLGTAFTPEHARILTRYCSKAVVLFDSDRAGQLAAEKSLAVFMEAGLPTRHLLLPEGLDPDEFIRKYGTESFQKLAAAAPDHFVSFLNMALTNYRGTDIERVQILEKVGFLLAGMADRRLKSLYIRELANRLDVPENWIEGNLVMKSQGFVNTEKNENIKPPGLSSNGTSKKIWPKEEQTLVKLMLKNQAYCEAIIESGIVESFSDGETKKIAEETISSYCKNPNDFDKVGASLVEMGLDPELITTSILDASNEADEWQLVHDCIKRVRDRQGKLKAKEIINSLKIQETTDKLEQFMNIAKDAINNIGPEQNKKDNKDH